MNCREYFNYDPLSGSMKWKTRSIQYTRGGFTGKYESDRESGSECGTIVRKGYRRVKVNGASVMVHRIAWEILNGPIPDGLQVDHINGRKSDNRAINLRLATNSQNQCNSLARCDSKSGIRGVYWHSRIGKWAAQITAERNKIHLGYFDTIEEASNVRKNAENVYHGQFARTA